MKKNTLGIAYGMKKKNEHGAPANAKMARPMPDQTHDDKAMVARNEGKKAPSQDQWTDNPTVAQAQANNGRKVLPIKHPKMVPSSAFSTRLRTQEDHLQRAAAPGPYGQQPPSADIEMGANRQGPSVPALKMKRMAKGGIVNDDEMSGKINYVDRPDKGYGAVIMKAKGGMINDDVSMHSAEEDMVDHPAGLEEDDDQMRPSEHEYMSGHFAEGGEISDEEEMMEQHDDMVAAVMAKRRKESQDSGSMDEDDAEMMAEGGQVDLEDNAVESDNYADDLNMDALGKENYSEESALNDLTSPMDSNEHEPEHEEMNKHDMVSQVRRKMRSGLKFK